LDFAKKSWSESFFSLDFLPFLPASAKRMDQINIGSNDDDDGGVRECIAAVAV
jgi:hypothetical protein